MPAIIGRKVGMTQIFGEDGARVPLTVIEAGPCPVTQVKTAETRRLRRRAARLRRRQAQEPQQARSSGTSRRPAPPPVRHLHEFSPEELGAEVAVGDVVTVEPFEPGQMVRITGTSKGKGYAGTIKRHNFKRGPKSHGSHNIRRPGLDRRGRLPGPRLQGHADERPHGRAHRSPSAACRSSTATPSATCCSCAARSPAASTAS